MRHVIQLDDLRGQQDRERLPGAIAEAALPLEDGPGIAQISPKFFALLLMLPQSQVRSVLLQDFFTVITCPVGEGIVHEHEAAIAHARDGDQYWAGLESDTEPGLA